MLAAPAAKAGGSTMAGVGVGEAEPAQDKASKTAAITPAVASPGAVTSNTTAAPSSTAPTPSAEPKLVVPEVITLAIKGMDPKTAPTISVEITNNSSGKPTTARFTFEGTKQRDFGGDKSSPVYKLGNKAELFVKLEGTDGKPTPYNEIVEEAIAKFKSAADLMKKNLTTEDNDFKAEMLVREAIRLLDSGASTQMTIPLTLKVTDPRLREVLNLTKNDGPFKLVDPSIISKTPTVLLTNLALGREQLTVCPKSPGEDGNIYETTVLTTPFGIEVEQSCKPRLKSISNPSSNLGSGHRGLSARLVASTSFDPGNHREIVNQSALLRSVLVGDSKTGRPSILLQQDRTQEPDSPLGSAEGSELARIGALRYAKNMVIKGVGLVHEKLDSRGAVLDNVTVEHGVFQLEGKLLPGSKITVKAGTTLMLDLEPGSEVTLIVETGGKVMSGPRGLGIRGCKVAGGLHGDLSGLDMQNVTWGVGDKEQTMTWKSFRGMIYDNSRCDKGSMEPFSRYSSKYKESAALLAADLKNFTIYDLHELLNNDLRGGLGEKFSIVERDFGSIVPGKTENHGSLFRLIEHSDGTTAVQVIAVALAPRKKVSDLEYGAFQGDIVKPKEGQIFKSPHDALLEILRQRNGGGGSATDATPSLQSVTG